ncbi:MAG: hypothetical protein KatS3mg003_0571 [Candidatus Nitrosocaldaceae archaeon]|nr:MAG: hypothetical protein KatS3mg003_0571 [Candidatus Nitrosocaldaceae archaeon]
MNLIFPEKEFGRGCDIVEVIGNSKFYRFIEIKRSTLGLDDINKAIEEFSSTIKDLEIMEDVVKDKILLHDKRRGCKTLANAIRHAKLRRIKVITLKEADDILKGYYNRYKESR